MTGGGGERAERRFVSSNVQHPFILGSQALARENVEQTNLIRGLVARMDALEADVSRRIDEVLQQKPRGPAGFLWSKGVPKDAGKELARSD